MCRVLEPRIELGQNMSYSTEIWLSGCFYGKQYEYISGNGGSTAATVKNCLSNRITLSR